MLVTVSASLSLCELQGLYECRSAAFFASILHDIRVERVGVKEIDHIRFLVFTSFFLEFFLLLRQAETKAGIAADSDQGHDFDLIAELTEPSSIGYVCARMRMAMEEKPPMWTELHAVVNAFIQVVSYVSGTCFKLSWLILLSSSSLSKPLLNQIMKSIEK